MSKKLKEPKKKRGDSKNKEEEQASVSGPGELYPSGNRKSLTAPPPQRRRNQNRASQRAYRERREQRLTELEAQVQEAEMLNQTLTAAYQELRAEMDGLQAEKAQEQYYASMAAASSSQAEASSSYDASYGAASSSGAAGGYGGGQQQADPNMWAYDSNWVPEEWDDGGNGGGQQY